MISLPAYSTGLSKVVACLVRAGYRRYDRCFQKLASGAKLLEQALGSSLRFGGGGVGVRVVVVVARLAGIRLVIGLCAIREWFIEQLFGSGD